MIGDSNRLLTNAEEEIGLGTATKLELPAGLKIMHLLMKQRDAKRAEVAESKEPKASVVNLGIAFALRSGAKGTLWEYHINRKVDRKRP